MQRELFILLAATSLIACRPGREDPNEGIDGVTSDAPDEATSDQGTSDSDDDGIDDGRDLPDESTTGDGDGDGDGDDQDAAPDYCDLSSFQHLTPVWLAEVESPVPDTRPSIEVVEHRDAALFAAGRHGHADDGSGHYLERRELHGELAWAVALPEEFGRVLALEADDTHVYALFRQSIRRWTLDGLADELWLAPGTNYRDMAIGETVATIQTLGGDRPFTKRARAMSIRKSIPMELADSQDFDALLGFNVARSPAGGWIFAGLERVTPESAHVWLRSTPEDERFSTSLAFNDHPTLLAIAGGDQGLTLAGNKRHAPRLWISRVAAGDHGGSELWRYELDLCGDADSMLASMVDYDGAFWGLGWVRVDPSLDGLEHAMVLVNVSYEGQLVSVHALDLDGVILEVGAFVMTDEGAIVAGRRVDKDGVTRRVLGRVAL